MNEEILYYGAIASLLELVCWTVVGALALRRYRKRRASQYVKMFPEKWVTPEPVMGQSINWQTRLKDWYTGEEEE